MSWPSAGGEASRLRNGNASARLQHRLRRLRGPGIELGTGSVAQRKAQPRHIDRHRQPCSRSLPSTTSTGTPSWISLPIFTSVKVEPAQVHRQSDRSIERSKLWRMPDHVLAQRDQRGARQKHCRNRDRQRNSSLPRRRFAAARARRAATLSMSSRSLSICGPPTDVMPSSAVGASGGASAAGIGMSESAAGAAVLRRLSRPVRLWMLRRLRPLPASPSDRRGKGRRRPRMAAAARRRGPRAAMALAPACPIPRGRRPPQFWRRPPMRSWVPRATPDRSGHNAPNGRSTRSRCRRSGKTSRISGR